MPASIPGHHLNLKWSVADVDKVVALGRRHWSASDIRGALTIDATAEEIIEIGRKAGVFIRTKRAG